MCNLLMNSKFSICLHPSIKMEITKSRSNRSKIVSTGYKFFNFIFFFQFLVLAAPFCFISVSVCVFFLLSKIDLVNTKIRFWFKFVVVLFGGPCGVGISTLGPLMTLQKMTTKKSNKKWETAYIEHDHVVKIDLNSCFRYWNPLGTIKLLLVTKFTLVWCFFCCIPFMDWRQRINTHSLTKWVPFFLSAVNVVCLALDKRGLLTRLSCILAIFTDFIFVLLCCCCCRFFVMYISFHECVSVFMSIQWHILWLINFQLKRSNSRNKFRKSYVNVYAHTHAAP